VQQLVAQKHIDNVLDIKDDEIPEGNAEEPRMVKSKTMPSMREEKEDNVWGSFNGSFFDTKPSLPITNPPPRKSETSSGICMNIILIARAAAN
jgi:hypothetical protein